MHDIAMNFFIWELRASFLTNSQEHFMFTSLFVNDCGSPQKMVGVGQIIRRGRVWGPTAQRQVLRG